MSCQGLISSGNVARRREFITLLGSAAVCPLAARAQQQVPVIGFLNIASPETWEVYVAGFKQGLAQTSFVEEVNVAIEYRWARGQYDKPSIPLGKRFWVLSRQERSGLNRLFQSDDIRELVTSLRGRKGRAEIKVLDAAYWVKGCSSLGRLRYAVLVGVGAKMTPKNMCCLFDLKVGVRARAPGCQSDGFPRGRLSRTLPKACDRPGCLSSTD